MAMENGPFIGDLPIQIMIFHSYVSLPEGKHFNTGGISSCFFASQGRRLPKGDKI
jgi:hypothetical protein